MKRGLRSVITQDVVDAVFADQTLVKKFGHPVKDKRICEARANGEKLAVIGKRNGTSDTECGRIVRKALLLYALYGDEAAREI